LEESVQKSPRFGRKQPKRLKSYLPAPQIQRIQQRHIAGEKNSAIARAEGCDRHTVSRIVKAPEMRAYVAEMKERFNGFAPLALDTVEAGLATLKDTRLACEVLKAIGVIEPRGNMVSVNFEREIDEAGEERLEMEWLGRLTFIAMEKHHIYGTTLEPELAKLKYPLYLEQVKSAVSALLRAKKSRALSSEDQE
jgi:hypothetical protein